MVEQVVVFIVGLAMCTFIAYLPFVDWKNVFDRLYELEEKNDD